MNNDYLFAATEGTSVWQIPSSLVGVSEMNVSGPEFYVFPNPSDQSVVIDHQSMKNYTLKILDVMGKEIFQSSVMGQRSIIDVSKLDNGIYFVMVSTTDKTKARKLVVQH